MAVLQTTNKGVPETISDFTGAQYHMLNKMFHATRINDLREPFKSASRMLIKIGLAERMSNYAKGNSHYHLTDRGSAVLAAIERSPRVLSKLKALEKDLMQKLERKDDKRLVHLKFSEFDLKRK